MNARCFFFTTMLLSSFLAPCRASAQTSDGDKASARDLAIEGYRALKSKEYKIAADRFTRADALYHAPTVILGLARAYVGLGKLVSAQELYNRTAHEALPSNASNALKKAVQDAQKELDALALRIPSVVVNVKGNDAPTVTLDGAEVRVAALGVKRPVDPGKHVITASAPGFVGSGVTVTLEEGKTESVTLELKPRLAAPPPVVAVNPVPQPPKSVAQTPEPPPQLVKTSSPEQAPIEVQAKGRGQSSLGFIVLGVGAASLLVGGASGGVALGKHGDIAKSCPEGHCPQALRNSLQPSIDSYNTMGTISTVGFIAGGALVATGAVLILTAPKAKTTETTITPLVGFGFIGATGSF